ncbi:elongation factor P hydroxylase [Spartinivicinus sp. A2-2]|uniref:Elongation factor P hydroxylase n=2 Tax=Spartinivicinus poritis TaxID=2994640 RepID=A0ABT5UC20_9GAMM|nr:elongation factor P hydroxylase [Spartinivicinus sp. A2-2]
MNDCIEQLTTNTPPKLAQHQCDDLVGLFNQCFQQSENTVLVKGDNEPLYLPQSETSPYHQVIFAHGFFSSALHEIAHWCIAGPQRRLLLDYGYWYQPDGRTQQQQTAFEQVESKPQALEWIFSKAAGIRFFISADNLSGPPIDTSAFKQAIFRETLNYLEVGLPKRAQLFTEQLLNHYQPGLTLNNDQFSLTELI